MKRRATQLLSAIGQLGWQFEETINAVASKERRTRLWALFGNMQEILNEDFEEQFDKEEDTL